MPISFSACSVTLNAMATQYTCSLNSIYRPHWLVQWSHHCSHVLILVHSPCLPGYIDVTQNILVVITMAGLFSGQNLYTVLSYTQILFHLKDALCGYFLAYSNSQHRCSCALGPLLSKIRVTWTQAPWHLNGQSNPQEDYQVTGKQHTQHGRTGQSDDSCPRWDKERFHHTTQNDHDLKHEIFTSEIFHFTFSDSGWP